MNLALDETWVETGNASTLNENLRVIKFPGDWQQIDPAALLNRIKYLYHLQNDWNGKQSLKPSEGAMKVAIQLIKDYKEFIQEYEFEPADLQIVPLTTGGYNIEFFLPEKELEIEIANENTQDLIVLPYVIDTPTTEEEGSIGLGSLPSIFFSLHNG